jgi:GNAT superfamily N-acetyltransferase
MVTLPDWQGLGIGMKLLEIVAAAFSGHGKDVLMPSAHPSLNRQLDRSPLWLMTKNPENSGSEATENQPGEE